jgi:hypothetical protein
MQPLYSCQALYQLLREPVRWEDFFVSNASSHSGQSSQLFPTLPQVGFELTALTRRNHEAEVGLALSITDDWDSIPHHE